MYKKILQLMAEHMSCNNASAPNVIGDAVFELLCDNGVDEQSAEKIADAAFELASAMVMHAGKYI
jgi:anti-sigma regulatory factor (Ser/Thr protein kinase)